MTNTILCSYETFFLTFPLFWINFQGVSYRLKGKQHRARYYSYLGPREILIHTNKK